MNDNLVIVGLRGVGKTTCSKLLSQKLGMKFVDSDQIILSHYPQRKIGWVHNLLGEEKFRALECAVISSLKGVQRCVISTGGGAILSEENCKVLGSLGRFICFHMGKEELKKRWESMPPYMPEIASFESWFDGRYSKLKSLDPIWINPMDVDWMEKLLERLNGK